MTLSKLFIQIPCLNEAEALPKTLADLPRTVEGFEKVEWLIVDDGSTDNTADVASKLGVDHIVSLSKNRGLAVAFMAGIERCLELGADVIVNTDADNQYRASDIPKLVEPIVRGQAQIVIGARPITQIEHFSLLKKVLQRLGSYVVRILSGTTIPDAPSGFRAIHRDAALRVFLFSRYTYTLETIIQAGRSEIPIISVPISVNEELRPSRLVKSLSSYVRRSILTILRIFIVYEPFKFFLAVAIVFFVPAVLIGIRYLGFYLAGDGAGHVQSLLVATILTIGAGLSFALGVVCDVVAANRRLLEDLRYRQLKSRFEP